MLGSAMFDSTGDRVADQRHERLDRGVEVLAAAGEGVAEAAQVLLLADPRALCRTC